MVSYASPARNKDKSYAIDPRTALFQHQWDRSKLREPHRRMAEALGVPFTTSGIERHLEPSDFQSDSTVLSVTRACLEFQLGFRTRQEDARKLNKYKKLLGLTDMRELGEPQFLIPPYFQFDAIESPWYDVSLRSIAISTGLGFDIPIRPVLHFLGWANISDWGPTF